MQRIKIFRSQFFEKINKMDKHLTQLNKRKKESTGRDYCGAQADKMWKYSTVKLPQIYKGDLSEDSQ